MLLDLALNLIDGQWCDAASRLRAPSLNPADGSLVGHLADSARTDGEAAIAAARRAFENPQWSQNPRERQMVMLRWADAMEKRLEHHALLLTRENGKPLAHSRGEIGAAISEVRYYAGLARFIPGHVFEVEPGTFSTMLKEPAGVAGIIVPWNAPIVLLIRALTPALAAGCTAVVKPAPQTALVSAAVIEDLVQAGLPKGVVNLVNETGHAVAALLAESDDVDVISFTGSNATGRRIMAAAAPSMKKLSLELGGKSCCLVFEDADVEAIAPKLAAAATIIAGQQCTAARRVLVHGARYDAMKSALAGALAAVKIAHGEVGGAQMGPLIDPGALRGVGEAVARAQDEADEVLLRGQASGQGCFFTPSLVAQRDTSAFFVQEEIFGPLVVIERFEDEAEAVARANHSEFGLSASVWTENGARALRVARALRNGTVWINDHNKLFAEAETGGYRKSGLGRLHGYDALMDFTEIKHIYLAAGVVGA